MFTRHHESRGVVAAAPEDVFALLDDHARLSSHMSQRSWKMGWGKMETILDANEGKAVGSRIVLRGRVFGVWLFVEEVVTHREPPRLKTWETVGKQRLLVIGGYRMGFTVAAHGAGSLITVSIDYALPATGVSKVLGWLLGDWYARWCTRGMVSDAGAVT